MVNSEFEQDLDFPCSEEDSNYLNVFCIGLYNILGVSSFVGFWYQLYLGFSLFPSIFSLCDEQLLGFNKKQFYFINFLSPTIFLAYFLIFESLLWVGARCCTCWGLWVYFVSKLRLGLYLCSILFTGSYVLFCNTNLALSVGGFIFFVQTVSLKRIP